MKLHLSYSLPQNSALSSHVNHYHYCDSISVAAKTQKPVDELTRDIFKIPLWVRKLLSLRNFLVKPFGLFIPPEKEQQKRQLPFLLIQQYPQEMIMGERDKHLDFWVSVRKNPDSIVLTTLVHFHNALGRLYFLLVKPFHKLIVCHLLKRFKTE